VRYSIIFLIILAGLLFNLDALSAQDEPLFEAEGAIVTWFAEVIYPEAILFSIEIGVPAEQIASASLVIQPEGGRRIPITIDLEQAIVQEEPTTQLNYLWDFPLQEAPRLFSNVIYEWVVSSTDNQSSRLRHFIPFQDMRIEWRDESIFPNLRMILPTEGPSNQRLHNAIEPIYNLLAENTGTRPTIDLLVINRALLDSLCTTNRAGESVIVGEITGTEVPCDPEVVRGLINRTSLEFIETDSLVLQNITDLASQRLTEIFYAPLWGNRDVPDWFVSGLGNFYSPNPKGQFLNTSLNVARTNTQFTLNEMNMMPDDPDLQLRWQAQSYGMVLYMADQIGVPALFDFARSLGTSNPFDTAYQVVMQQPLSGLIPAWRNWLFTEPAASAYGFTPYLEETPAPSPTRSPTPFPPTETLVPSATPTNTPLPTITGVRSATPLPTRTPTATPRRGTPTVTPRPAGSLPTVTPVVVPSQASNENSSPTVAIAIVVGAALIGSVIGLLVTRIRR